MADRGIKRENGMIDVMILCHKSDQRVVNDECGFDLALLWPDAT
jgi:hypothetical protein